MAIFKAEDVYVNIDGTDLAAISLNFQSSPSKVPVRRFGEVIDPTGFAINGPQRSSMTIDFLLTGSGSSIFNPILNLLSGIDAEVYEASGGMTDFIGIYSPYNTGEVYVQKQGSHFLNYIWWSGGDSWAASRPNGQWVDSETSADIYDNSFTGLQIRRAGYMGCLTGSIISLGGTAFASGAALNGLTINITPFAPIACQASFDIYNEVTGQFTSGQGSINIHPNNVAHGLYSTYSGIFTNVDEVTSIKLSYSAQREPRFEYGKKHISRIDTLSVTKTVEFNGYGRSETLKEPTLPLTITLGSANQSNIFTDTISGIIMDDSFDLPNVGIISKSVRVVQNMV